MGVHGLWKLVEPSGKPVRLESLTNKVLAVDVSIWIHQAVKRFKDAKGTPVPNAHLIDIYRKLCKLLYFKIKPVFVFDGGVPSLKRYTIEKRNQLKSKSASELNEIQQELLNALLKHSAVSKVLYDKTKASLKKHNIKKKTRKEVDNMYVLPETPENVNLSQTESESSSEDDEPHLNIYTIDMEGDEFKSLPWQEKYEILTEVKETRKQSSWGRLKELPKQSDDFSDFQMKRLLKRRLVHAALDEMNNELCKPSMSLTEVQTMFENQGIGAIVEEGVGNFIASDENKRYVYVSKDKEKLGENASNDESKKVKTIGELEEDAELRRAIEMSLQEQPSTSSVLEDDNKNESLDSFTNEMYDYSDSDDEGFEEDELRFKPVHDYMMEYSGLVPNEINRILKGKNRPKRKKIEEVEGKIDDLNKEKVQKVEEKESNEEKIQEVERKIESFGEENGQELKEVEDEARESVQDSHEENQQKIELKKDLVNETELKTSSNEKEQIIETNSDEESGSDDFEEVEETKHDDSDLFNDIFKDKSEVEKLDKILNEKLEIPKNNVKEINNSIVEKNVEIEKALEKNNENDKHEISNSDKELLNNENNTKKDEYENAKINVNDLKDMKNDLEKINTNLRTQKISKERMGTTITEQMYEETQELLELFGVPYVIAPMEAEAQCAFLEQISLTDGTITDDSDIWLFGGRTVYKNFFNQSKYVMEFKNEYIQNNFKLTREQLILFAILVGSDYTLGVQGIGPVTALEILSQFPMSNDKDILSGLKDFKTWMNGGGKGGKFVLKNRLNSVTFAENFPNFQIAEAYLNPVVETSRERFSWGKPDAVALRIYAEDKFGWNSSKVNEVIGPVLRRLADNTVQTSITDYGFAVVDEEKMSKRVVNAVKNMGKSHEELAAEERETKKRKGKTGVNSKPTNVRKRKENSEETTNKRKKVESLTKQVECLPGTSLTDNEELKLYETVALELKRRRRLKQITSKPKETYPQKSHKKKPLPVVPEELQDDPEVQHLLATTSKSVEKQQQIENEIQKQLLKEKIVPVNNLHSKEVVHQKLREKDVLLKNKLKAVEVFRKSKSGPGYVPKGKKRQKAPKEDANLSEESE